MTDAITIQNPRNRGGNTGHVLAKRSVTFTEIRIDSTISLSGSELPQELLLSSEGSVQTFYAPFDYINTKARITICGITPGHQQAVNALSEARKQLRAGTSVEEARRKSKETASFSGPMRNNLIAMLDYIGIAKLLDIDSCARLSAPAIESNSASATSAPSRRDQSDGAATEAHPVQNSRSRNSRTLRYGSTSAPHRARHG